MSNVIVITHDISGTAEYTSTSGADLSVTSGAGLGGTGSGLQIVIDDTTADYGLKSIASNSSGKARARFYIDPNSLTMANGDRFSIFTFHNSEAAVVGYVVLNYETTLHYRVRHYLVDDGGTDRGAAAYHAITDEPHYIELYLTRASSDVAADGNINMWIDGVDKGGLATTYDNYHKFDELTSVRLGEITIYAGTPSGTLFLDELVVNDDGGAIGPIIQGTTSATFDNFTVSSAGSVIKRDIRDSKFTPANYTLASSGTSYSSPAWPHKTLAAFTLSSSGSVISLSQTIEDVTLRQAIIGYLTKTLDNFTLSADGAVSSDTAIGSLIATLANFTLSSSGSIPTTGTIYDILDDDVLSASATNAVTGSLGATLANFTVTAVGTQESKGTLDKTLDGLTLASNGFVLNGSSAEQSPR